MLSTRNKLKCPLPLITSKSRWLVIGSFGKALVFSQGAPRQSSQLCPEKSSMVPQKWKAIIGSHWGLWTSLTCRILMKTSESWEATLLQTPSSYSSDANESSSMVARWFLFTNWPWEILSCYSSHAISLSHAPPLIAAVLQFLQCRLVESWFARGPSPHSVIICTDAYYAKGNHHTLTLRSSVPPLHLYVSHTKSRLLGIAYAELGWLWTFASWWALQSVSSMLFLEIHSKIMPSSCLVWVHGSEFITTAHPYHYHKSNMATTWNSSSSSSSSCFHARCWNKTDVWAQYVEKDGDDIYDVVHECRFSPVLIGSLLRHENPERCTSQIDAAASTRFFLHHHITPRTNEREVVQKDIK